MTVVHLAIHSDAFRSSETEIESTLKKYELEKGTYLISVGRVELKKNIDTLIEAFSLFKKLSGPDDSTNLVLAGSFGFGKEQIQEKIENSKYKKSIYILGYIPDEDMVPLLNGALAYVFPSRYEGFGIPALGTIY